MDRKRTHFGDERERLILRERIPINSADRLFLTTRTLNGWKKLAPCISRTSRDAYGWISGMRWSLCNRQSSYLTIEIGAEKVVINIDHDDVSDLFLNVFASTDQVLVTVLMFEDQLYEDITRQMEHSGRMEHWVGAAEAAKDSIERDTFSEWWRSLSIEQQKDPLMVMLIEKYRSEHNALLRQNSSIIRDSILNSARAFGVRFASISLRNIVCFENRRTHDGRPVAWVLAELFDMNRIPRRDDVSSSIDLYRYLLQEDQGIYDLREPTFKRIAYFLQDVNDIRANAVMNHTEIKKIYDDSTDLENWLERCIK